MNIAKKLGLRCWIGCCVMISGCSQKEIVIQEDTIVSTQTQHIQTIYVLGDSLSAGYQLPLEQSYPIVLEKLLISAGYKIKVINAGESGDTSAGLKERLERLTQEAKTGDIALVVIGGNDGLQGLSTKNLQENIIDITTKLQQKGLKTVIGGMQIPTNLGNEYREAFRIVYIDSAQETNSPLIPFILSGVGGVPELNLPDGIHPNATGQIIVANTVKDFLLTNNIITKP